MKCSRLLLALPLALLAPLTAAAGLQPFVATYVVIHNGDTIGHATMTLRQIPGGWDFENRTVGSSGLAALAAADIDEHSQIVSNNGQLQLSRYDYRLSTLVKSSHREIVANPATRKITISDKKRVLELPLQPGVLDQQSVTLGIAQDLANGKHGTLTYPVATKNNVDTQRWQVGGVETLKVPAGTMRAVPVRRMRDSPDGRVTASWFGVDNGYVPVRILQREKDPDGEILEMQLVSLKK